MAEAANAIGPAPRTSPAPCRGGERVPGLQLELENQRRTFGPHATHSSSESELKFGPAQSSLTTPILFFSFRIRLTFWIRFGIGLPTRIIMIHSCDVRCSAVTVVARSRCCFLSESMILIHYGGNWRGIPTLASSSHKFKWPGRRRPGVPCRTLASVRTTMIRASKWPYDGRVSVASYNV